ncbi:DinB family protein [Halobacillus sp. A5]|uniref:DinB family protein n=1 Tax=Halobacillus sp. A5 TaxID=2880263 RepID=UPI0020A6D324|nr:DinB family protein [Halobacillus sp. A5]MCP3027290.1 DinB family protein [Halobacillus sp. A5]
MSKSTRFTDYFLSHREVTNELTAKIDKDYYNYKPTPSSMEAQKLVIHIYETAYMFARMANGQEPNKLFTAEDTSSLTEQAETYTEQTLQLIHALSDDDFNNKVDVSKIFGRELTVSELLHTAVDHEIHHKGNLFVYVREMGHTDLPIYVKLSK